MSVRSILAVGAGASITSNGVNHSLSPHGSAWSSTAAVETYYYRSPIALTVERLASFDTAAGAGTGRTLRAFLNGSASALIATIADGGSTGTITENTSDSVSVATGDRVAVVGAKTGGGTAGMGNRLVLVAPGSNAVSPYVLSSTGTVQDSSTRRFPISGRHSVVSYTVDAYMKVRSPGNWRGLFAHVTANSGSGSVTLSAAKNDTVTALAITIGVGETGHFWNNADVISVADGDNLQYRKTGTTGANVTLMMMGSSIVNSGKQQQLYGYASRAWAFSSINTGGYVGLPGHDYGNSIAVAQLPSYERTLGFPAKISKLQVGTYNGIGVSVTTTLLVNGSPSALSTTVAAGAVSALTEDLVDEVTVAAGDKIAFLHKSTGATSGTFFVESLSFAVEDLTVDPATLTASGSSTASLIGGSNVERTLAASGSSSAAFVVSAEIPELRTLTTSGSSTFSADGLYAVTPFPIRAEIQGLTPSARIELFELDTAVLGGPIYRFHAGTNALREPVTWNGEEYSPFPVQANGFDYSGQGPLPRPKLRVANVAGVMSALVTLYDDLAGCKVTRIRTLAKFLDAVNFPAGNPTADPDAEYPREVYFIDRKASEDREMVEFELASSLDMVGVMFPSRQVIQNYCPWAYRGPECGYTGTSYFDTNDQVVAVLAQDVCGKRLSSCRKRFGQYGELPYGGFPAAGLLRL
jgi:lambda family phage minor tail protein L